MVVVIGRKSQSTGIEKATKMVMKYQHLESRVCVFLEEQW